MGLLGQEQVNSRALAMAQALCLCFAHLPIHPGMFSRQNVETSQFHLIPLG